MSKLIYILNGPNLNLLGQRQPEIYGHATLADVARDCAKVAQEFGCEVELFQSNHEGVIIDTIHEARLKAAWQVGACWLLRGGVAWQEGKTETALKALDEGVRAVTILDGRVANACLMELFTDHGAGSQIRSTQPRIKPHVKR